MELRVHDLVRLDALSVAADEAPAWVHASLRRAPWAVVRRAVAPAGRLALGVRGTARAERAAIDVPRQPLLAFVTPESLSAYAREYATTRASIPAFRTLAIVDETARRCGLRWGPGGSVGFEIATGVATVNERSDCDIVIRADGVARDAFRAFAEATRDLPARVDAILEYTFGGVALDDYLAGGNVIVKTSAGATMRRIA